MAGSISLALQTIWNPGMKAPNSGGLVFFIKAGTTAEPQNVFFDQALTIPLPNPYTLEDGALMPYFFVADGFIKIRITDRYGVQIFMQDGIMVIGPSSGGGGGGGGGVDATTVLQTGDIKTRYGTGALAGFVRLNARTIGSSTSGATERSNADCQALFQYLWGTDSSLDVSGGRGASAVADWDANKTIQLPDGRGRVLAALDDMGNSAAGRLSASYFGASGTMLGAAGGSESSTLIPANLPPYTPSGSITNGKITVSGGYIANNGSNSINVDPGGFAQRTANANIIITQDVSTFTGTAQGGTSAPVANVQPTLLITNYIKL